MTGTFYDNDDDGDDDADGGADDGGDDDDADDDDEEDLPSGLTTDLDPQQVDHGAGSSTAVAAAAAWSSLTCRHHRLYAFATACFRLCRRRTAAASTGNIAPLLPVPRGPPRATRDRGPAQKGPRLTQRRESGGGERCCACVEPAGQHRQRTSIPRLYWGGVVRFGDNTPVSCVTEYVPSPRLA